MLKQSALFKLLKKKGLSIQQYHMIYYLSTSKGVCPETHRTKIPAIYLTAEGKISEDGKKFLKQVDALFKPMKNLSDLELLGDNFSENIDKYTLIFPTGKLPNGQYARGNKKSIQSNFVWFFQEYDYTWDTIITATQLYVNEYRQKDFMHMRTAMYFIKKIITGSIICDLATYCDTVLDGAVEEKEAQEEETINLGNVV